MRRQRLLFERDVASKVFAVKKELTKFQSAKQKYEPQQQQIDSEDEWQEDSDSEVEQYEIQGKAVSKSDVHNMLHLTSAVNLMEDETRVKYHKEINNVKAGKFNLPKKIFYGIGENCNPSYRLLKYLFYKRLALLSADTTRWARRLIKTGEYKWERLAGSVFAKRLLWNILADKKIKVR